MYSGPFQARFAKLADFQAGGGRLELWSAVVAKTVQEPSAILPGAGTERGMASFGALADHPVAMIHEQGYEHAHNNLVQYLLDYGLAGIVAYVGLWGYLIVRTLRIRGNPEARLYRRCGLSLILVFNLCGLTEFNWGRSLTHYNVMVGMGLVLAAGWILSEETDGSS